MKQRSQDEWRELIEKQEKSGLKARQFCKEQGINEKYFSTVKHKLKEKSNTQNRFQSLGILREKQTMTVKYHHIEIDIPLSVDALWLSSLTKQLAL